MLFSACEILLSKKNKKIKTDLIIAIIILLKFILSW